MKKNMKVLALSGVVTLAAVFTVIPSFQYVQAASTKTQKQNTLKEDTGKEDTNDENEQELTTANTKTSITEEQAKQIALDSRPQSLRSKQRR